jgi:hypothetical protein
MSDTISFEVVDEPPDANHVLTGGFGEPEALRPRPGTDAFDLAGVDSERVAQQPLDARAVDGFTVETHVATVPFTGRRRSLCSVAERRA